MHGEFGSVNPTAMRRLPQFLCCEWFPSAAAGCGILTWWMRHSARGRGRRMSAAKSCQGAVFVLVKINSYPPCPVPFTCPLGNGDGWAQSPLADSIDVFTRTSRQFSPVMGKLHLVTPSVVPSLAIMATLFSGPWSMGPLGKRLGDTCRACHLLSLNA